MLTVFGLILQWRKQGFEMYQSANGYKRPWLDVFCLLSRSHLSAVLSGSPLTLPILFFFLLPPHACLVSSERLLKEIPCSSCLGSWDEGFSQIKNLF